MEATKLLAITFSNLNWFSKFFHCLREDEIYNLYLTFRVDATRRWHPALTPQVGPLRFHWEQISKCYQNLWVRDGPLKVSSVKGAEHHEQHIICIDLPTGRVKSAQWLAVQYWSRKQRSTQYSGVSDWDGETDLKVSSVGLLTAKCGCTTVVEKSGFDGTFHPLLRSQQT